MLGLRPWACGHESDVDRGGKRAVDAIAAGLARETPAYRALTEAAALGPDFSEGRAAFAESARQNLPFAGRPRR